MMIHTECEICHEKFTAVVHHNDLRNYQTLNMPMQRAFPYLTADVRELFFGVGWCGECWDKQMGFDDEGED